MNDLNVNNKGNPLGTSGEDDAKQSDVHNQVRQETIANSNVVALRECKLLEKDVIPHRNQPMEAKLNGTSLLSADFIIFLQWNCSEIFNCIFPFLFGNLSSSIEDFTIAH
jgi:hypothetical protein